MRYYVIKGDFMKEKNNKNEKRLANNSKKK
jgi:hypothetical protein